MRVVFPINSANSTPPPPPTTKQFFAPRSYFCALVMHSSLGTISPSSYLLLLLTLFESQFYPSSAFFFLLRTMFWFFDRLIVLLLAAYLYPNFPSYPWHCLCQLFGFVKPSPRAGFSGWECFVVSLLAIRGLFDVVIGIRQSVWSRHAVVPASVVDSPRIFSPVGLAGSWEISLHHHENRYPYPYIMFIKSKSYRLICMNDKSKQKSVGAPIQMFTSIDR